VHKKVCSANAEHNNTYSAARLKDLDKHIRNPSTRLDQGKHLHDRPEKDVYKLLIDSFRTRQADDLNLEDKTTLGSIYSGASSSVVKASARKLMPPW
jgi:splicing suppressor protein 51